MTRQRLYQTTPVATPDTNGMVTLTFPQVPQGLAWTGSVSMFATPLLATVAGKPGKQLVQGPLQGSTWWLSKNQSPLLQMAGGATALDVQCIGQETLSVVGTGLPAGRGVVAVWSGWSDDLVDAPFVEPHQYGVTAPSMQVFNGGGQSGPLQVAIVDDPARTVTCVSGTLSSSGGTLTLFTPGIGATAVELHSIALQVTTANSGTTAQALPFVGMVRLNDPSAGITNLVNVETICVNGSAQEGHLVQPMYGMPVPQSSVVDMACSTLASGNSLRVQASVVLSYVAPTP